jgi:disulfide bond formation protein DsbB
VKGEIEPMRNALRGRFWLETVIATVTSILFVITLVWHDWIEIIFKVDPDQGSGLLEWSIVGALLVVAITLFVLARYEWRRARTVIV